LSEGWGCRLRPGAAQSRMYDGRRFYGDGAGDWNVGLVRKSNCVGDSDSLAFGNNLVPSVPSFNSCCSPMPSSRSAPPKPNFELQPSCTPNIDFSQFRALKRAPPWSPSPTLLHRNSRQETPYSLPCRGPTCT